MEKYVINGGNTLHGEVEISGAKNAAVAIIPAAVLAQDVCVIENVPNISDVSILFQILNDLGAKVRYLNKNTVEIDTRNITEPVVPYESARHLRASYYFLGAFLGRFGEAHVSPPGGCNFGVRPIDQHIKGFEALGATVTTDYGFINATCDEMFGCAHLSGRGLGGRDGQHHAGRGARQGTDHFGKRCQGAAHRRPCQLLELDGGGCARRGHRRHQDSRRGASCTARNYSIIPDQIEARHLHDHDRGRGRRGAD